MSGRGRPLRFLAVVTVGWIGIRVVMLWPQIESVPDAVRAVVPFLPDPKPAAKPPPVVTPIATAQPVLVPIKPEGRVAATDAETPPSPMRVKLALMNLIQFGPPEYVDQPAVYYPSVGTAAAPLAVVQQRPMVPSTDRWSASAWLVARPGTGLGAAPDGSQLGGSQAGVRVAWLLDPRHRVALYGRFAAPLVRKGREAAFGVDWQPTRLPVRLIAEERIDVDSHRTAPGVGLVAGWDGSLAGFRLESYGQAGVVKRSRAEPYADGAARATHDVAKLGKLRLSLGAGAWGAAQREAARLDVGPSAVAALPLGGASIRVALDWRQRIAGDARPGSGFALTLGGDF